MAHPPDGPCLANALEHEPGGGLRSTRIALLLHRGNGFRVGQAEADAGRPLSERDHGGLHGGPFLSRR